MCTAQLSVESPLSWVKDTPALSESVAVSDRTEPESFGQPEPEKTRRVIVGEVGGAARTSKGRERRVRERIMTDVVFGGRTGVEGIEAMIELS
jgi:hypothetical protein